jgi:outer membrane lipoprotein-sorting protein
MRLIAVVFMSFFQRRISAVLRAGLFSLLCLPVQELSAGAQAARGDAEAVAIYHEMVGAFRKAKSLELACKAHFKTDGFEANVAASLLLKQGNKMRLEVEIKGTKEGQPYSHRTFMVSNGTSLFIRENQEPWNDFKTTTNWNETVLNNITRGGFPTGLEIDRIKSKDEDPQKVVAVAFFPVPEPAEFVLWKKEQLDRREVIPVEFKVKGSSAFIKENAVILWVDASTHFPVKRMNVIHSDRTLTVTENYETVSLNPELDDSRFERPRDR